MSGVANWMRAMPRTKRRKSAIGRSRFSIRTFCRVRETIVCESSRAFDIREDLLFHLEYTIVVMRSSGGLLLQTIVCNQLSAWRLAIAAVAAVVVSATTRVIVVRGVAAVIVIGISA